MTILYKRGEDKPLNPVVLKEDQDDLFSKKKEAANQIWEDISMMDKSEDHRGGISMKSSIANSKYVMGLESNEDSVKEDQLFSLEVRMESRILRDAFLTSLRLMLVRRSIPLPKLLENVDYLIRKEIFPVYEDDEGEEYKLAIFELQSYRDVLKRMLNVNKSLNLENDSLNECILILRNDIEVLSQELQNIKATMGNKSGEDQAKFRQIEKNLLDTSYQVNQIQADSEYTDQNNNNLAAEKVKNDYNKV